MNSAKLCKTDFYLCSMASLFISEFQWPSLSTSNKKHGLQILTHKKRTQTRPITIRSNAKMFLYKDRGHVSQPRLAVQ